MAKKFGRNYRLTIQMNDGDSAIVIQPPFTLEFNLSRNAMASLNQGTFMIYNLGPDTRNKIFQDWFNPNKYRKFILEAGYGSNLTTIFQGAIFQASSARRGTDIITTVVARDGGFDVPTTQSYRTVQQGTSVMDLVKGLVGDFTNLKQGILGDIPGTLLRPAVISGNTYEILQKYTNNQCYIDLETVNMLNNNQAISGPVAVIDSSTGLLETPRRDDGMLSIRTLFEPQILMGQVIELKSEVLPIYNGQYKVIGAQHQGVISEAVNGPCTSTFNCLLGAKVFGPIQVI